ncbi:HAD-IA family hydrolase [Shimia sp.]|uniref:HAD-IA family hydrolase n=1 Tax=Shimia sp. TaxID=1954381 RepID=UPI0035650223
MTLKALIFDVDGTLAETEEAHRAAFNRSFAAWGLDWSWSQETYRDLLKTTGGKERIKAFQAGLPDTAGRLGDAEIAALHKAKTARYADILKQGGMSLRPGVAEMVGAGRRAGLKLAIATTTNRPNVETLCRSCWGKPAYEIFDHIAAGDMVQAKKPAPDVYLLALTQLGLPQEKCLAIEDSRNGVLSARGAGLRVLVTPSAYSADEDFTGAAWKTPSLSPGHLPRWLAKTLGLVVG